MTTRPSRWTIAKRAPVDPAKARNFVDAPLDAPRDRGAHQNGKPYRPWRCKV
jgi:hypothetical protein